MNDQAARRKRRYQNGEEITRRYSDLLGSLEGSVLPSNRRAEAVALARMMSNYLADMAATKQEYGSAVAQRRAAFYHVLELVEADLPEHLGRYLNEHRADQRHKQRRLDKAAARRAHYDLQPGPRPRIDGVTLEVLRPPKARRATGRQELRLYSQGLEYEVNRFRRVTVAFWDDIESLGPRGAKAVAMRFFDGVPLSIGERFDGRLDAGHVIIPTIYGTSQRELLTKLQHYHRRFSTTAN